MGSWGAPSQIAECRILRSRQLPLIQIMETLLNACSIFLFILQAYAESIEAKASPNSAVSVPNSLGSVAAVAVAIVAGGAFLL